MGRNSVDSTTHVPMQDLNRPGPSSGTAPAIGTHERPRTSRTPANGALAVLQPRPGPATALGVYSRTSVRPTEAHAWVDPTGRQHDDTASAPPLTVGHRRKTLATIPAGLTENHPAAHADGPGTVFDVTPFFPDAPVTAKPGRRASRRAANVPTPTPSAMSNAEARGRLQRELQTHLHGHAGAIAGMALAAACEGDANRARQAFTVLRSGSAASTDERAQADAFATACRLSATGVGLDILQSLRASQPSSSKAPELSEEHAAIQMQADMTAHQAAERLLAVWPHDVSRPNSLDELAHVCNALTGRLYTDDLQGDLRDDFQRRAEMEETSSLVDNTDEIRLVRELVNSRLADEPLAMKALLASVMLRKNPGMALQGAHAELALPYLAARNQIYDEHTLQEIGDRLFKMLEYADRAAAGPTAQARDAITGKGKNPLAALSGGTGGQLLREPEPDFDGVAAAVDRVTDALAASMAGHPAGTATSPADFRKTVRVAILDQWVKQIGESHWRDRTRISLKPDSPVMARVAEILHLDADGVAEMRRHAMADLGTNIVMTPERLRDWAAEALPEGSEDEARLMEAGLAHVEHMQNRGDIFPAHASADDYLMAVRRSIALSRMTYGVRSNERRDLGVNFAMNWVANRSKTPVILAGPAFRATRRVGADVYAGSTALAGALEMTTQRGFTGAFGGSAVFSWSPAKWFGVSASATLLGVTGERASIEGAAIRTRFQPPDLESWRTTLLGAFDSMYGVRVPAEPGGAPEIRRPADARALLDNLASTHAKAPDLSLGRVSGSSVNIGSALTVSAAGRFKSPKTSNTTRGGPGLSVTQTVNWLARRTVNDDDGGLQTRVVNQTSNTNTNAAVNLSVSFPGGSKRGSAAFTPVNLLSASAITFPMSRGGTLRFSMDNGKVAPTTAYDTEFARPDDFKRYADSRRGEWLRWTRTEADDAGNANSTPEERLDAYLERAMNNAETGQLVLAERIVMQPDARARMDELLAAFAYADALPPDQRDTRRAELRGELDTLVGNEESWGPRFLYVNEINGERTEAGVNYLLNAAVTQEVTTAHQLSAYRAEPTPRDRPE
ncbi:hypothetical protein C7418_4745 [Cupriavidus plantarum]|nr:hypothetical protein C7418_4745 [Cupriavidus plantarum]